jgi:hypothetical protein
MATSLNTVLQLDPRLATLYEIAGSLKPISIDVVCLLSPRCALHTPLRYSKRLRDGLAVLKPDPQMLWRA